MFKIKINNEISIALVQESFAAQYAQLVSAQIDYLSQWLAWPPHCQTEQDFRIFIQRSLHDYAEGKSMTCAIVYQDAIVGNCSFNTINHDLKKATVGYWLSESQQGKGIVTQVVTKLIKIAFEELDMEKVEISAAVENTASRAVCERLGCQLEGIITRSENLNGRIVDHAIYGLERK
ncbi:GNAT family N-acetyltransferase [Vibrio sp. D404a]|uniref:GNAT family N-acetyltransferase n=1 Tax=unclassified Vibrio TaxID=2614977 RepID=UPI002555B203|nr:MULTISPECIES: GNAT family protein [unclassified Vibrio]MDK9736939.1 GNAT family N-acetyltransferase [Vibrio sp. D404a]MDK9798086.1 GNAT family N-acetyltransferase [Vibrio sp. D449a]